MDDFDFSGLTDEQQWLLLYQGWRVGQKRPDGSIWPQPGAGVVQPLIERGLLQERSTPIGDAFALNEYFSPLHVHMAFCASCPASPEVADAA